MGIRAYKEAIAGFVLLCLLWVFIGFTWDYTETNIEGFRIYHQGVLLKDNIPASSRSITDIYVDDATAYGTPFTMTAYGKCLPDGQTEAVDCESEHSEPAGLAPRLPSEIELVPGVPKDIGLD